MAVETTKTQTTLVIKVKEGTDQSGKDIIKGHRISKVKVSAKDEDLLDIAAAMANLMKYPLNAVAKEDDSIIARV
jgi:hypothetical protein